MAQGAYTSVASMLPHHKIGWASEDIRVGRTDTGADASAPARLWFVAASTLTHSLDKPVLIANVSQCAFDNTTGFPSLAVDSGSFYRNRLYVAWNAKNSGESPRCQIYFSYSTDNGKSWSAPVHVNDDISNGSGQSGPDDYGPTLAVNRSGTVGIAWHDRRDYPDDLGYEMRFTASLDGGRSFIPSVPISVGIRPRWENTQMPLSVRFSTEVDETEVAGFSLPLVDGDYNGMAAGADGTFHPIWSDARRNRPDLDCSRTCRARRIFARSLPGWL